MSWSVNTTFPVRSLDAVKEIALQQNPECSDQFDAVATAVQAIIDDGAVGRGCSLLR